MKKILFIASVLLIFNSVYSQDISKEERKQRKVDFKFLIENLDDTEISYENLQKLDKIKFINKDSEYKDDIKLINKYDLHRFISFQYVFNDGKKFYMFKEGIGEKFPNEKNLSDYIPSEEILNIYNFVKADDSKCMLFEFKTNLDNSKLYYVAIQRSNYTKRMIFLKKQVQLWKIIEKEEFNISFNTYYETEESCHKYAHAHKDFIVVSSTHSGNQLLEETYNSFNDKGYAKSFKYKSKSFNIGMDYFYLNFELDSIKYYSLDVIALLNSGILRDSITTYWGKLIKTQSLKRYYDLKERICKDNFENESILDKYSSKEIEEMSINKYWEQVIPKTVDLGKYISVDFITLPMSINAIEYEINNEINSSEFVLSMYKFDDHRSDNGFLQGTMTKCKDRYCYNCKVQINYECALKQYDKSKYLYSSINPENIREELINSLTEMFCKKSGVINSDKQKKEEEGKYKNDLAEKYGLKYVEAALVGDIILGMPEDLLTIPLRAWNIDSNSEWENGYLIYCKFKFDTSKRIKIIVRDGKVSEVSKW